MSTTTTNKIPVGDAISQVAKEEGGTTKGSKSAKMQSAATRSMNQQGGQGDVAGQTVSEVIKELKGGQPEKGGPAAKMQSAVGKERNAAQGVGNSVNTGNPATNATMQSALDREANFQAVAASIATKAQMEPQNLTQEDASLLRSRDVRAHGTTEKGGFTSQVQSMVAENAMAETGKI